MENSPWNSASNVHSNVPGSAEARERGAEGGVARGALAGMPCPSRLVVDGGCYHMLARGNNRAAVFQVETDRQRYAIDSAFDCSAL